MLTRDPGVLDGAAAQLRHLGLPLLVLKQLRLASPARLRAASTGSFGSSRVWAPKDQAGPWPS